MNAAHFHLALNHLPVIGLLFGLGVVFAGRFIRSDVTVRVGLWLLVLSGILAIPAYLTGEPAEDVIEQLAGISKVMIEKHEDAASASLTAALLSGTLAGVALFLARGGGAVSRLAFLVVSVVAVGAVGSMAWTAKLGGEIHHQEVRSK